MVAPLNVPEVTARFIGLLKAMSDDFSQRTTLPVLPTRVRLFGVLPLQMVWLAETVPPMEAVLTVIVTIVELTVVHTPLCTTALK